MRAGSFTTMMHDMPSGSHATQSHQRSRNRTPPTQAFPLRLVGRERVDILRVVSCKQDCHSYHLRRSASKIGRRNSRKTAESLNCPPAAWQRATTRHSKYSPKDHKARLASGHPFIVFAEPHIIRLPFVPFFEAPPTREKNQQRRRPKNSSRRLLCISVSLILGVGHQRFAQ